MNNKSSIVVTISSSYDNVRLNIERGIKTLGPVGLSSNQIIVIKINMADVRTAETGTITHPLFLDAVLGYLRENYENLKINVVESNASVTIPDKMISWLGYTPVLEKWGAQFVNLSKIGIIGKKISGRYFREVPVPEIFERSDFFITLPKLKTNLIATITCCLKNQFGCLPRYDKGVYHDHLDDVIADVNTVIRPNLCLVDGIIAMGGPLGPAFGVPIPAKIIICSNDPVSADTYSARFMGFQPWFINHIKKSAHSGVGSMTYRLLGDKINNISFELSKPEMWAFKFAGTMQRKVQLKLRARAGESKQT